MMEGTGAAKHPVGQQDVVVGIKGIEALGQVPRGCGESGLGVGHEGCFEINCAEIMQGLGLASS